MIPYTRLILNLVLSSIFCIEEMLTINYNLSNGLSLLCLFAFDLVSIVNLILKHVLNLSCLLNYIDLRYKQ